MFIVLSRSVANFFNIPIEVTINSIPHLTLEGFI